MSVTTCEAGNVKRLGGFERGQGICHDTLGGLRPCETFMLGIEQPVCCPLTFSHRTPAAAAGSRRGGSSGVVGGWGGG